MAVAVAINETDENLQNKEADFRILHEGGGKQAVKEVARQG